MSGQRLAPAAQPDPPARHESAGDDGGADGVVPPADPTPPPPARDEPERPAHDAAEVEFGFETG